MPYKTKDVQIASLLKSQNKKFSTEKELRDVVFVFQDDKDCEKIVSSHNNGELMVNSADLIDAMHAIKKIIFNLKSSE